MELGDNKGVKKNRNKYIISISILVLLAIVLTSIFIYENRQKPLEGRALMDIDGHKMFVSSTGEGKTPIILINGASEVADSTWLMVKDDISKLSRVITFDWPGTGTSEKVNGSKASDKKVEELHALLKKTAIKGPYILVAHSIGGFDARLYVSKYPKEVAGIILLDATPEEYMLNIDKYVSKSTLAQMKVMNNPDANYNDMMKSAEEVKAVRSSMKNIPLIVIAAGKQPSQEMKDSWLKLQKDVAALSLKSKIVVADNSSHKIMLDSPEVVVNAVKDMLNMIK